MCGLLHSDELLQKYRLTGGVDCEDCGYSAHNWSRTQRVDALYRIGKIPNKKDISSSQFVGVILENRKAYLKPSVSIYVKDER